MKMDVAFNPSNIGFFSSDAVVLESKTVAYDLKKTRAIRRNDAQSDIRHGGGLSEGNCTYVQYVSRSSKDIHLSYILFTHPFGVYFTLGALHMAIDPPVLISSAALVVSVSGFALSAYVAVSNARLVRTQKRTELLTLIAEAKIQYKELSERYRNLASRMGAIPPNVLDTLIQYKEYEKLTQGHYEFVQDANLSAAKLEEIRHHIEGMILAIAADNRRIDDAEQKAKASV